MSVKLVSDAQAIMSMRESDFDAYSAYGEVVDNSIQAQSTFSKISFKSQIGTTKSRRSITEIAFGDNGCGMSLDTLHKCLQLGFSTRYNDRSGIGRFGVGMTLAGINQCKCIEVFSKQVGGDWYSTKIDLDSIEKNGESNIEKPTRSEIPNEYKNLVGNKSGTLVIWSKYDRQNESDDKLIDETRIWMGRTYRYFLRNGFNIFINNKAVYAIDPLYCNWEKTEFPDDPPGKLYSPIIIEWPIPGENGKRSNIVIHMSMIDESFRPSQGAGGKKENVKRCINRNNGISILRNKREVFYGDVPHWPSGGGFFAEIDRWWGCEIQFDAVLDSEFMVKNIKRGAVPVKDLKKVIHDKILPTRKTVIDEVRRVWAEESDKKIRDGQNSNSSPHEGAEIAAAKIPSKKPTRSQTPPEDAAKKVIPGAPDDEKAKWIAKWKSQPFTIMDGEWDAPLFFEVTHTGGNAVIKYNSSHAFIKSMNRIYDDLKDKAEVKNEVYLLKGYIDLLIIAFANAGSQYIDDDQWKVIDLINDLQLSWGRYLKSYLKAFEEEYGVKMNEQ